MIVIGFFTVDGGADIGMKDMITLIKKPIVYTIILIK
jgi:hypothetical protein